MTRTPQVPPLDGVTPLGLPDTPEPACPECDGEGMIPLTHADISYAPDLPTVRRCRRCRGRGTLALCTCGGEYLMARFCGAYVCDDCENHQGLARCYCGWSASGGDGRRELVDMGEVI